MVRIREATQQDAEAIAQLHAKSWRQTYRGVLTNHYLDRVLEQERLDEWQQRLGAPHAGQYVVVLEPNGATPGVLAGFACAYGGHDAQAGTLLENLHAHPDQKRNGTGRLLLQHIARWSLKHYPHDGLHLWVAQPNVAAIGFYRHMGATEDATAMWDAPDGSSVPELRYTWRNPGHLLG